ncbi:MAG: hypothetical protein AMXMBFR33_56270 [Candidatus Xenobia bacterium]
MNVTVITRPSMTVELAGRQFRLEEFSVPGLQAYLAQLEALANPARCVGDHSSESLAEAFDAWMAAQDSFLAALLATPLEGEPPTAEWVREHVSLEMRRGLVQAIDELNRLPALVTDLATIREVARGR